MNPKLSVVLVCLNHPDLLRKSLSALAPQARAGEVELIAVGHWGIRPASTAIQDEFREVTWLSVAADETVPRMRARGIARSRGEIVALLEDDCVVNGDWCQATIRAHEAPFLAIGGPIAPGDHYSRLDWAVFLCEFGRFLPPLAGRVAALPGNNVSYKKAVLSDVDENGFEEVFFHRRLQQSGAELIGDPKLVVVNVNRWSLTNVASIPFHHGRAFASNRLGTSSRWRRRAYGAMTVALPLIKVARVAAEVFARRKHLRPFLGSLPGIVLFVSSWSFGECLGAWFGAGDSARRWV